MNAAEIKQKLYDEIERADPRLLRMLYTLAKEYHIGDLEASSSQRTMIEDAAAMPPGELDPALAEKKHALVMEDHSKYLKGERKVYSWDEVKEIAKSKKRTNEA